MKTEQKFYPVKFALQLFNRVNPEGNKRFSFRAFTLIELLVVIAILGLIASIVLINSKVLIEETISVGVLQFSGTTHHALGAYAVGIWDFDDQTLEDKSGNGNNGKWQGTSNPVPSQNWKCASDDKNNTPSGEGCSLSFDGSNDYIEIADSDTLDGMDAITIEFWIKPDEEDKYHFIRKKNCYEYKYKDNRLEFKIHNGDIPDFEAKAKADISMRIGKWHHLVASYNGSSEIKLFLDAKELSLSDHKVEKGGPVGDEDERLYLGSKDGNKEHYEGLMDEVKIYRETLIPAQIKKLYVEGAEKRELLKPVPGVSKQRRSLLQSFLQKHIEG